jgi:hypothetical protein
MTEPIDPAERDSAQGEPLPEMDPGVYPADAGPLVIEELTEDDLKGEDIHRDDLSGDLGVGTEIGDGEQ